MTRRRLCRWPSWSGCRARAPAPAEECEESLPADGPRSFRLRPVRPVGCTGGTAGLVRNGPRNRRVVALTFDDGPSSYTPAFLDVLRARGYRFATVSELLGRRMVYSPYG